VSQFERSQYPSTVWGVTSAISEHAHQGENWVQEAEQERVASTVVARVAQVVAKGGQYATALEQALAIN
jgi:hypothetical protein